MTAKQLDNERKERLADKKQAKAGNAPSLEERKIFAKFREAVCCGTCGYFYKCKMAIMYHVCDLWRAK